MKAGKREGMVDIGAIGRLPRRPGVYIMKGAGGEVLYVGKAVDIRRRVSSYFTPRGDGRTAIPAMVSRAGGVDFIVTDTEKEALLLEETLIREHRPRYNVSLKEAGSCAHIRIAEGEEYPRIEITRRFRRDGARWFGPYSSVDAARRTVRFLQRIFPLRDCASPAPPRRSRPCLSHQIGRCPAPCRGLIGRAEYAALVRRACLFLSGRDGGLLRELEGEMRREAAALRFEKAREIRETIAAIRKTIEGQKTVSLDGADSVRGDDSLAAAIETLVATRPTAVNLRWAAERMRRTVAVLPPGERAARAYAEAAPHWTSENRWDLLANGAVRLDRTPIALNDLPIGAYAEVGYRYLPEGAGAPELHDVRGTLGIAASLSLK